MALRRAILLFGILSFSISTPFVTSSSVEPRDASKNRWLTYACGSKGDGGGGRSLRSRILTHPCNSPSTQSTANDVYNKNTLRGSNTFVNVTLGIICGVASLLGLIFIVDRETFTEITGVKEVPEYCSCSWSKPLIEGDDDDMSVPSPFEQDNYHLTEETQDYLAEKQDREVDRPKRMFKRYCSCFFKTKREYGSDDKYNIPWTGDENEPVHLNKILAFLEDLRLRMFWRPTKKEFNENVDKYAVNLEDMGVRECDDDIKIAASSYESADPGAAPW